MTGFCPHCGVAVPSNCISCPKCFREIPRGGDPPRGPVYDAAKEDTGRIRSPSRKIVMLLATLPVLFGLLGLGQIYINYKDSKGYMFLIAGLILFWSSMHLIRTLSDTGFFVSVLMFAGLAILMLIYVSAAIGAFIDAAIGSVFTVLKF